MNKTPSNEGSSSGIADVKYQKAIKEISKLISLNTALKKENTTLLENYDKIVSEYDNFKDKVKQMGSIDFEDVSISGLEKTAGEDDTRCLSSKGEESKYGLVDRNVEDVNNKIEEKDKIIGFLNDKIDGLNHENKELTLKLSNLHDQVSKFKNLIPKKDFEDLEKENKKLKKELLEAINSLEKMCKDYTELQKQLSDDIPNAKSIEQGQFKDPLSDFYIEKLKRVEQENIKLRKENSEKKNKLKSEIGKLREDNEEKLAKLMYLTSFVEKQQHFIEKFIISEKPPLL